MRPEVQGAVMGPLRWIKTLARIIRDYDRDMKHVREEVDHCTNLSKATNQLIIDRTEIDVDLSICAKDPSTVIVIGRYRRGDYIQTYRLSTDCFDEVVGHLNTLQRQGHVNLVDAPPQVKAFIKRDHRLHEFGMD